MTTYPFLQIDAFTDRPLGGNACAVLLDTDALDAATMQAVAREMNLSETSFVRRSSVADFGARYFTPAEEIPMAGHPTIATAYALVQSGRLALTGDHAAVTLELPVGPIPIDLYAVEGRATRIVMTQKKPVFGAVYAPESVLPVFGLSPDDALPGVPIQTVSTGTPQLMIPLRGHDALRRAQIQFGAYHALRAAGDFFSPHLFCRGGATAVGQTFARHFGTPPDFFEDPVTGSATGGMAAYLWRYRLIDTPTFLAEQGHWMGRPGSVEVEIVGPPDAVEAVKVGGSAVAVLRGEMTL